ncbi:MAG: hypothetical protein V9F00_18430 [Nocardioides sp.]
MREVVERGRTRVEAGATHLGLGLLGGAAALDLPVEVAGDRGDHAVDLLLAAADER